MESMTVYQQGIEALCRQAREQAAALEPLGDIFAQEAKRLFRHDQAVCLRRLKARVMREVSNTLEQETTASNAFTKTALVMGAAEFALGGLVAAMFRSRRVFSVGTHLAQGELSKTKPFGTVLVAVGHGGLPNDVEVVSLSRLARESGRLESNIEAALQTSGYLLMTPQTFSNVLDELKCKVLNGSLSLPVAGEQLPSGWASH